MNFARPRKSDSLFLLARSCSKLKHSFIFFNHFTFLLLSLHFLPPVSHTGFRSDFFCSQECIPPTYFQPYFSSRARRSLSLFSVFWSFIDLYCLLQKGDAEDEEVRWASVGGRSDFMETFHIGCQINIDVKKKLHAYFSLSVGAYFISNVVDDSSHAQWLFVSQVL